MSIIVSNCQQCDDRNNLKHVICTLYTIFSVVSVVKLFIRVLLLNRILALEKNTLMPRVHFVTNVELNFRHKIRSTQTPRLA